ncbi:hypothetical protein [Streptomyces sp. TRM49041]|nr:hypothetical protein [Streptomyces sp. TRM49041]
MRRYSCWEIAPHERSWPKLIATGRTPFLRGVAAVVRLSLDEG